MLHQSYLTGSGDHYAPQMPSIERTQNLLTQQAGGNKRVTHVARRCQRGSAEAE